MNITQAQYKQADGTTNTSIFCLINGQSFDVPLDPANRHYAEILKQVADGTITIAEAD